MKLRKINVTGILPILVFEDGPDGDLAIWNHVCDGTSCLADSFDTKIKFLLNAHGITDIEITDHVTPKTEMIVERGCNDCHFCDWEAHQDMNGSFISMTCQVDQTLPPIHSEMTNIIGEKRLIHGRLFRDTKDRATPCEHYRMTISGLNKWVEDK